MINIFFHFQSNTILDTEKQRIENLESSLNKMTEKYTNLVQERDQLLAQLNTNSNPNSNGNLSVKKASINESTTTTINSTKDYSRSHSNSTDSIGPSTPLRSILSSSRSLSSKTPFENTVTTPITTPTNPPEIRPVRSLSATRSVSFRGFKPSITTITSDTIHESPESAYIRPRTKTQLASEFTSSSSSPPSTTTTTFQEKVTPTRRASVSFGKPTAKSSLESPLNNNILQTASAIKFLEEISQLRKEITDLTQLGSEMEGLYKDSQIEIQYLLEGKRRIEIENKKLKEKYEQLEKIREGLEKKLTESKNDEDSEVHEEILWTKIQVEKENTELKLEYEKLEREFHKLKNKLEKNETKQHSEIPIRNSITKIDQETKINLLEQQMIQLNEIIHCRDLQIKKLCLYNQIKNNYNSNYNSNKNNKLSNSENNSQTINLLDQTDEKDEENEKDITERDNNNNNNSHSNNNINDMNNDMNNELSIDQQIDRNNKEIALLSLSIPQYHQNHQNHQIEPQSSMITSTTLTTSQTSLSSSSEIMIDNQNQLNEIVSELIQCKLFLAINLTKIDTEKLRYKVLKYNQRKYLTKITELEVENVLLLTKFNKLAEENHLHTRSWYPKWLKKYIN